MGYCLGQPRGCPFQMTQKLRKLVAKPTTLQAMKSLWQSPISWQIDHISFPPLQSSCSPTLGKHCDREGQQSQRWDRVLLVCLGRVCRGRAEQCWGVRRPCLTFLAYCWLLVWSFVFWNVDYCSGHTSLLVYKMQRCLRGGICCKG